MGAQYRAYITVQLVVDYESPQGQEAELRAADLVDIVYDKLPNWRLYRSRRQGNDNPHIPGLPVVTSKACRLDHFELRAPTGPGTGLGPTKGYEEGVPGRR